MQDRMTSAAFLARQINQEREQFAVDAQRASELMAGIAANPTSKLVGGDLSRLSQQVAELVRRASRIDAWREAHALLESESTD